MIPVIVLAPVPRSVLKQGSELREGPLKPLTATGGMAVAELNQQLHTWAAETPFSVATIGFTIQ